MLKYIKVGSKFKRKYGKTLIQLCKELKVSGGVISVWERNGFDIFYKAKILNLYKKNKYLNCLWKNLTQRCGNPNDKKYKYYGGKGIKVRLSKTELKLLWERDKGWRLKKPSIDRLNSNKDYEFSNCRFIEMSVNRKNNHNKTKK